MNYKVLWTKNAYSDFAGIVFFIKDTFGKKSAEDFVNHLDSVIKIISSFPQIGRIIHTEKQIRALLISKQVKLIYRLKSGTIIILNLFDTRQNPDKMQVKEKTIEYKINL